jgi:hypothetical protein
MESGRGFDDGTIAGDFVNGFELFEGEVVHFGPVNFIEAIGNYIQFYCWAQAVTFSCMTAQRGERP